MVSWWIHWIFCNWLETDCKWLQQPLLSIRQFHRLPIGERPLSHQATRFTCRKLLNNCDLPAKAWHKARGLGIENKEIPAVNSGWLESLSFANNWHLIYKYTQTVPKRHTVAVILVMPQSPTPFFPSVTAALITSGQACSFFPFSQVNLTKKKVHKYTSSVFLFTLLPAIFFLFLNWMQIFCLSCSIMQTNASTSMTEYLSQSPNSLILFNFLSFLEYRFKSLCDTQLESLQCYFTTWGWA